MKAILVVLDGAGDRPSAELGGRTPLQAASMPNLRRIAGTAAKGMIHTVGKEIAPESDAAVFSILGYDVESYTGRGPLEAYGAGLKVDDNTLALRCNFATIDSGRNIVDRRAGRIESEEAKQFEKEVNAVKLGIPGVRFKFRATVGHRGVVAFYSSDESVRFSSNISNADIGYVRKGNISVAVDVTSTRLPEAVPLDGSRDAELSARVVNTFLNMVVERLSNCIQNKVRKNMGMLKANVLLLRDAGVGLPKVEKLKKRHGMSFGFIAEMPVEIGIARLLGMKPIKLGYIKDRKERYLEMARLVNSSIDSYDFLYVHIKGPDEPGHDGKAMLKKQVLEEIDGSFFGNIAGADATICVTADHSTPCSLKAHSADPVPLLIRRMGRSADESIQFDESIGDKGSIGIIMGTELLNIIIKGD